MKTTNPTSNMHTKSEEYDIFLIKIRRMFPNSITKREKKEKEK